MNLNVCTLIFCRDLTSPPCIPQSLDIIYRLPTDQIQASNATVSAEVDALHADLKCKVINATWSIAPDDTSISTRTTQVWEWNYQTTDAECPYATGVRGVSLDSLAGHYAYDTCDYGDSNGTLPSPCRRWWLIVAHVELDDKNHTYPTSGRGVDFITARGGESSISSIACEPKYEMRKARVVTDGTNFDASLIEDSPSSTIPNITAWDILLNAKDSEMRAWNLLHGTNVEDMSSVSSVDNVTLTHDIFALMNYTMLRNSSKSWMDTNFLIEAARKSFQGVATQVALQYLTQAVEGNSTATIYWTENRLVLQKLSFYLVTSILLILIAITVALLVSTPAGVVPRDVGSIAGMAAIVASSPELGAALENTGYSAAATKHRAISFSPFHTGMIGRDFGIGAESGSLVLPKSISAQQQKW